MTASKLFLAGLFGLFSCGQQSVKQQVFLNLSQSIHTEMELWTLYSKSDTIYHVKRLVYVDSGHVLLTYDINVSQPEAAHQIFLGRQTIEQSELKKIKSGNSDFNWEPFKATPILFVQLKPVVFKDEMAALDKRHEIERLIDKELKSKNLGAWIAGDLGPGGANMLFEVQDIEKAKMITQTILLKNSLDKAAIIGRRINTEAEDWFYEVIYPVDFNGVFLTM